MSIRTIVVVVVPVLAALAIKFNEFIALRASYSAEFSFEVRFTLDCFPINSGASCWAEKICVS